MASMSPPTPRVERVSPQLALVASESDPYASYRVEPDRCSCLDWHYRRTTDPHHRCKHMQLAFPIRCTQCGTNQVPAAGDLCGWCAEDLNELALQAFEGEEKAGQR